jgi:hypothetical protein
MGRRLLRNLRFAPDPRLPLPRDARTPVVDEAQLQTALENARAEAANSLHELAAVLIDADRTDDPDLAEFAVGLLAAADARLWKNLDLVARRTWWDVHDWAAQARDRISSGEPSTLALVVASFHPIGFVREAAVARLGEIDDPITLPVLALRTADWVTQVRDRARAAIARPVASSVDALLGIGPVAVTLAERTHGNWLYSQLGDAIARLDDEDLGRILATSDWRLRRAAYTIALRDSRLGRSDLVQAAERDTDRIIKMQCADAAVRAAVAAGRVDEIRPLATSGTAIVRAVAITALARAGETDRASAAIADTNPIVRDVAQAALRRIGVDPAEQYRALAAARTPADPSSVAGLGEAGDASDIEVILPSLKDVSPRGRVEAVRALRRLGWMNVPLLSEMLDDSSAAVTRQVAATLVPRATDVDAKRLAELLDPRQRPHVRSAAYRLLRMQGVWTRVRTDLELLDDEDEKVRGRARGDLFGWVDRNAATTYSMPTGAVADQLDVLLRQAAPSLGPSRERLLRFHLGLTSSRP